ncbi:hemagglutinin repeat-containing protein [Legionella sp. CNM-4043-24]|uniref:hemagglutinin repeat-containing protein n=1 Tax=Legionella sp. CNM-4043-24 TaxID=3421646 RepID=UPI00403B0FC3
MWNFFSILPLGKRDPGVIPKDKNLDTLPAEKQFVSHPKDISQDENQEYTIPAHLITSTEHGSVCDKDITILEWHMTKEHCLVITSHTDRQINLFENVELKECVIKASGPVQIAGTIDCESALVIEAEALRITKSIKAGTSVLLSARQGVGLLAPVQAQDLTIRATYVHQEADLRLSGQLDVSSQFFKQGAVKTELESLRLLASQCEINGELSVNKECFLTADAMLWGHEQSESTIKLHGEHHIHAGNLHIQGDTQIRIGDADGDRESDFIVYKKLILDKPVIVDLFNTRFSLDEMDNQGELACHQCTTTVKTVRQQGVFDSIQSLITVSGDFYHADFSLTELRDTSFSAPEVNVCGGNFVVNDCLFQGNSCRVLKGVLRVENTSEMEFDSLWQGKESHVRFKDSRLRICQSLVAAGQLHLDTTQVTLKHLKKIQGKACINQSTITAQSQIMLKGATELTESRLVSPVVILRDGLTINCLQLDADMAEIMSEQATITALSSSSKTLHLQGSKTAEQVLLRRCALSTSRFSCSGHVTLEKSAFFGVSSEPVSHDLHAHLKLLESRFITDSQLSIYADGKMKMDYQSQLHTGLLYSQGAMKARDSAVRCDSIWQKHADCKLDSSRVQVNQAIVLQDSWMDLKNNTMLLAPDVQVQQGSMLRLRKNSQSASSQQLRTSSDSTVIADQSTIASSRFISAGRTDLCSSLLSAEELFIYNQFAARQQSKITAEKLIRIAEQAHAHISDSVIASSGLSTFGDTIIHNAIVLAERALAVWSPAALTLDNSALVLARDMIVRGLITTKKTEDNEQRGACLLKIDRELRVTKNAMVKGNADLSIEATRYSHLGSMKLDASLKARGGVFNNLGTIEADQIYLGFDDRVVNLGTFLAGNMMVHSNFLNLTGRAHIRDTLIIQGFYGVNLGLILARNYTDTQLLSVHAGLTLSSSLVDPEAFLSWSNLVSVGKIVTNRLFAKYSGIMNLAFMMPGLLHRASLLADAYHHFDWERCKNMRLHEWMSTICQIKENLWLLGSLYNAAMASVGERSDRMIELNSLSDWQRLGADFTGIFANEHGTLSLVDINSGIRFAASGVRKTLLSVNMGVDASLMTHSVDNRYFYNAGWSGGGSAFFDADYACNSGYLTGVCQFNFKASTMENTGYVGGRNTSVVIRHLSQNGRLALSHGQAHILEFDGTNNVKTELTDMVATGRTFGFNGQLDAQRVHFVYTDSFQAQDESTFNVSSDVRIKTNVFSHGGKITSTNTVEGGSDTLFYVESQTADLHGSATLENAFFNIEHFAPAIQFISGQGAYEQYAVSGHFGFKTADHVILNAPFNRQCHLSLEARGITMLSDYHQARDLSLSSTEGDVELLSDITSSNLHVTSAGNIKTNQAIDCEGVTSFTADGAFYNVGGTINADTVAINAAEINNISAGALPQSQSSDRHVTPFGLPYSTECMARDVSTQSPWGVAMGSDGIINGRKDVYMEAASGDIKNSGGMIRAGEYAQLLAHGNVINACNVRAYRGAYDTVLEFDGGLIAGGNGADTEGVGLYIRAGGQVISDASDFVSNGINYMEADQGFDFKARQHTCLSEKKKSRTWYGKKSEERKTSTTVKNSTVHSSNGANILVTRQGGVQAVATRFTSPGGTLIMSRDTVQLYSLKTQSRQYKSSSRWWGLSKRTRSEKHQEAMPTLFYDNGVTRIEVTDGSIDARGAYFAGAGDLELKASGRIRFGVDILDHKVVEKKRGFELSATGAGAWKAWKSGGNLMDMVSAEDATMAKLKAMLNSRHDGERSASATSLGINVYNTVNNLARGVAKGTLDKELLARYGLGGDKGWSPGVSLSVSNSKTVTKYQTQGPGGVEREGDVYLQAGEGIDLENGVRVHADGNLVADAPELIATAATLHSSVDQKSVRASASSAGGQINSASVGYSHSKTRETHYAPAELSAGGNLSLSDQGQAMSHVVLDGAQIKAGTLEANIEQLDIIDRQDRAVTRSRSFDVSTSGHVSAYRGAGHSATTAEHSGIYVVDGINTEGHRVHVDEARMHGGKILTQGENHIEIDKLTAVTVSDHESYRGTGVSFNVNDLSRLNGGKATNHTGESAIAVAEVTLERTDYLARTTPVIYGELETRILIDELAGDLHTTSANGTTVVRDDELRLTLDVPITTGSHMQTSRENIKAGLDKIASALRPADIPAIEAVRHESVTQPSAGRHEEQVDAGSEKTEAVIDCDLSLSPEEQKILWDGVWSLMSEDDQIKIKADLITVMAEWNAGIFNSPAQNKLDNDIQCAYLEVFKAISVEKWGVISRQLRTDVADKLFHALKSPANLSTVHVQTCFGPKGVLISFVFNLGLNSKKNVPDLIKAAVTTTAGDVSFSIALSRVLGSAAGPVSWTVLGLQALDAMIYDSKYVDNMLKDEVRLIYEAQKSIKEGKLLLGIAEQMMATDELALANEMRGFHNALALVSCFGDAFAAVWDKVAGAGKSATSRYERPQQAAGSGHTFFRTARPAAAERSDSESLKMPASR